MVKKRFFIFAFLVFIFSSKAQQWQWAFDKGNGGGTDIETDRVGNVYLLASGGTYTMPCGNASSTIAKHDAAGNVIWAQGIFTIGGGGTSFSLDKLGNIYITGYFQMSATFCGGINSNITIDDQDGQGMFICKYDNNGNLQWVKKWGYSSSLDQSNSIKTDINGNSYVAGMCSDYNADLYNYFLLKYDSQGNLLWNKTSNWQGVMSPTSLDLDINGNCYVVGNFGGIAYFDSISIPANSGSIFMVKYNSNGDVIWAKKDGSGNDECHGISLDKRGNFYVTGSCSSLSIFGSTTLSLGGMLVAKYDTNGVNIWAKRGGSVRGYSIDSDTSGGCFITGFYAQTTLFGSGANTVSLTSPKTSDVFVTKFDKNGNLIWAVAPTGGIGDQNMGFGICSDFANNCYVTGRFCRTTIFGQTQLGPPSNNYYRVFITKIKDSVALLTNIKHYESSYNEMNVFPNPALNSFQINYKSTSEIKKLEILLRDATGEKVYFKTYKDAGIEFKTSLDTEKYPRGLYLIEIIADGLRSVKTIILN